MTFKKLSPRVAGDVLQGMFDQQDASREVPSKEAYFSTLAAFARMDFDIPESFESDGFLFQYGEIGDDFTVGITRQFEVVDDQEDYAYYLQVEAVYRWQMDEESREFGDHDEWWFRGSKMPFEEWFSDVQTQPVWMFLNSGRDCEFMIDEDEV